MDLPYLVENKSEHAVRVNTLCIGDALREATKLLQVIGIESALLDARLLMEQTLSCNTLELVLKKQSLLSNEELECFYRLLARRLTFEPIAYILGIKEFYGHEFLVSPHCLIPRPDSEVAVERSIELLKDKPQATIFDIGCGSGALVISILKACPGVRAYASDCSTDALAITQANAERLEVSGRISFLHGDLFEPYGHATKADLIVSNPPYIGADDFTKLSCDVREYEPRLALTPGDQHGLAIYERLLKESWHFLRDGGFLVLEIGFNQSQMVLNMADRHWAVHGLFYDLAGHARVLVLLKTH